MLTHLGVARRIAEGGEGAFVGPEGITARYAAMEALELVGEAARQLSTEFDRANPGIPVARIRGPRRRVAHPYDPGFSRVTAGELRIFVVHDAPRIERRFRKAKVP